MNNNIKSKTNSKEKRIKGKPYLKDSYFKPTNLYVGDTTTLFGTLINPDSAVQTVKVDIKFTSAWGDVYDHFSKEFTLQPHYRMSVFQMDYTIPAFFDDIEYYYYYHVHVIGDKTDTFDNMEGCYAFQVWNDPKKL